MAPLEYNISNGSGSTYQPTVPDDPLVVTEDAWVCQTPAPDPVDPIIKNDDGTREFLYGRFWAIEPYKFSGAAFGTDLEPVAIGNKVVVGMRYYSGETIAPDATNPGCRQVTRNYGEWTVDSQTIIVTGEGDPNDRLLYSNIYDNQVAMNTIEPGTYQSGGTTEATAVYTDCGVKSDVKYSYGGPFNLGDISYLPRLGPSNQGAVKGSIPTGPETDPDHDPPIYTINALTGFSPDSRPSVTITYRIETKYKPGGAGSSEAFITDTVTITQTVTQPSNSDGDVDTEYAKKIETLISKSYYEYNIQNMFLWDVDEPAFYTADGKPIGIQDNKKPDGTPLGEFERYNERTKETYNILTNGADMYGLTKEQDTPLPNPNPDDLVYDITGVVDTLADLSLFSTGGVVYEVKVADTIAYNNDFTDVYPYSPTIYSDIEATNEQFGETTVVVKLKNQLYVSNGDYPESQWFNITEDES